MRNKYIKYCDIHNIKDGVLREFLIKNNAAVVRDSIKSAIQLKRYEITKLTELANILTGRFPGEFCENCGNFIHNYKRLVIYCHEGALGIFIPCPGHEVDSVACSQKCAARLKLG